MLARVAGRCLVQQRGALPQHSQLRPQARRLAVRASQDECMRSISDNGQVSILVVRGTQLVQEACDRHKTSPTASAALGRALLGTLLMGAFREEGEKTQVTFKGDGPLNGIQVIADARGLVKGKVGNPAADPPLRPDGKLNVGQAVGRGVLAVVRSLPAARGFETPYTGMVPIHSGEIAEDLARYLVDSEQTQSALGLGVSIHRDLSIKAAGGFLIQVLPFAEDETILQLEKNIVAAGSMTQMLNEGLTVADITGLLLEGLGGNDTGFQLQPRYGPCEPAGLQERMRSAVALLGEKEVREIIDQQGKIEVTCEFCRETYEFPEEEVMVVIAANGGVP
ncbi:heat shock 33 [Micractinium conductrix]|uniref:Heat shock 33 n=1 Tax=Micractinium conductrix TaxID=554055 RepID=A0A2P6VMF4_9CHLO|nr:heat shock 33 [Micractinium conductrix]|eukprot:PSC75263.1 heat shock 33 [Micractinium conductrix]